MCYPLWQLGLTIMLLNHFGLSKSPKLTNDHLKIGNLKINFDLGSPYGTTININDVLSN